MVMTGRKKGLLAGLALSVAAAAAVAAVTAMVQRRSRDSQEAGTDESERLSELIRRLGVVEQRAGLEVADGLEAEALRVVLEKLDRLTGGLSRRLRRLSEVHENDRGLDEATLAHAEYLVIQIEARAQGES